ncbi:ABC transporter permease [Dorea sp. YH-dor226]|uniref:ABC transporter permease n=1 Tax=Dorea sp. YH-dor226 TaxID=3151119 RepID=UPI002A7DE6A9|nr:ABC transporter permease [Blautia obeum]
MGNKKRFGIISGREAIVLGIVLAMTIVFSFLSPSFRTYSTFVSVWDCAYYVALMAIGVTFPLITGGVDLSIGTGLVCYSLVGGYLIVHKGIPVAVALLITILLGVLIGLFNGVLIAIMDLPPFLATLCTCMITRGLGPALCGGFGVSWPSALAADGWFRKVFKFTTAEGKVIPSGIIFIVVLVVIMSFVLNHTKIGRYTIAIGSNKEATKLSGVNVKFYHVFAYVISGFFAGLAGIAYASTYATIYPGAGAGFEMDAIGGAIVGGVSASGGSGTILGTFLGVMVISLMKVGLPFIGLQANWQQICTGIVLILAVLVDIKKKKVV